MSSIQTARQLRRDQTDEEKQLWRALRGHRFAGFKFRRQHSEGIYILDFYCAAARLDVELDGFQHGVPEQMQHDEKRSAFLKKQGIEELRFWNHQWRKNREGCHTRHLGCVATPDGLCASDEECGGAAVRSAA